MRRGTRYEMAKNTVRSMVLPVIDGDAKVVRRLSLRNYRHSALVRWSDELGFIQVCVVGLRYFDGGAGPFMGPGAWIHEGHVVCRKFPVDSKSFIPAQALTSIAGWSIGIPYGGPRSSRSASKQNPVPAHWQKKFWTLAEALAFANGDDGGALAAETVPVTINRKGQVTVVRKTAPSTTAFGS